MARHRARQLLAMHRFVVDTHALIWFLAKNPNLGVEARRTLNEPNSDLVIPAIVLAEALWILTSRKLEVEPIELLSAIDTDHRITVYPLTREIVEIAQGISSVSEMHGRQIVATALHLSTLDEPYSLLTRDQDITSSGSVPVVW
jgi:PIN domain nuclease of toxin-antitoxin system